VDTYLREYHGLDCRCISEFLTTEEIIGERDSASEIVDRVLSALDSKISPSINKQFGLKMRYFTALYSYIGKQHMAGYMCFVKAMEKIERLHKIKSVYYYGSTLNDFFKINTDIGDLLYHFFPHLKTKRIHRRYGSLRHAGLRRLLEIARKAARRPLWLPGRLWDIIGSNARYRKFSSARKTVLLYGGLHEVEFLKEDLKNKNIIYYDTQSKYPAGFRPAGKVRRAQVDFQDSAFSEEAKNPFARIFLKDIKEDFTKNISGYINGVDILRRIHEKYPISLGIWGNSPVLGLKPIVFEFLRSIGIKVVGAQHGMLCGDSFSPWHFDAELDRCDYYISYGHTEEDVKRIYPGKAINFKVAPMGKVKLVEKPEGRKKIDILYPTALTLPVFNCGMTRIPPHILRERQTALLEYLNSLDNMNIYVKPLAYSTAENCCVLPLFRRLRNLKLVNDRSLFEFLRTYKPGIVLIDAPSQPLYECLDLDAEIFLMNSIVHPFEKEALKKLEKRVHYAENLGDVIAKMNLFLESKLQKKRDTTFYDHYVRTKDTRRNILNLIDSLAGYK